MEEQVEPAPSPRRRLASILGAAATLLALGAALLWSAEQNTPSPDRVFGALLAADVVTGESMDRTAQECQGGSLCTTFRLGSDFVVVSNPTPEGVEQFRDRYGADRTWLNAQGTVMFAATLGDAPYDVPARLAEVRTLVDEYLP